MTFSTGCYGNSPQTGTPAQSSGSPAFTGVWKDEQLVKREEVREGKSFPDRKGGLVKAELRSHRVRGGNKAIHCCVAPSARGNGEARSQEGGRTTCSLDALPGLSSMLLWSYSPINSRSVDLPGNLRTAICPVLDWQNMMYFLL